jgi:hypothetical protein
MAYEVVGHPVDEVWFNSFDGVDDDTPIGEIPAMEFSMPLHSVNPKALEMFYGGPLPAPPPPFSRHRVLVKVGDEVLYSDEATVTIDENGALTLHGKDWKRL